MKIGEVLVVQVFDKEVFMIVLDGFKLIGLFIGIVTLVLMGLSCLIYWICSTIKKQRNNKRNRKGE